MAEGSAQLELAALSVFADSFEVQESGRDAWLESRCDGNRELLARVRALLRADSSRGGAASLLAVDLSDLDPAQLPLTPPERVGVYRLEELIGAGGMGSVYRARRDDGLFDQNVAIKFIRPMGGATRVEPLVDAERRLLARMEHPSIARILDGGTTPNGLHYLVIEFVSGMALDDYAKARALDIRARVALLRECCLAVAHAHQHLVLHCDIKPANILVTEEGRPKLIDFGVARIQDVVDASLPDGFTRAYTSPQRLAGAPAAIADDVYSIGIVLHELVADALPDDDGTPSARLPQELAAIVRKATARAREDRYASVAALDSDLAAWLEFQPVSAMGGDWRYRMRKLAQRHPFQVAGVSLALVGLVSALVVIATLYTGAEAARADAEKRFGEVRTLANYMLFDLDTRLESVPGNTGARREMVARGQQYLDALSTTAGGNLELQREVAVGLARLGEVQGVPGRAHVGEPDAAKRNLERAERMLVDLVQRAPQNLAWRRDLGRTRYLLAILYGGRDSDFARQLQLARSAERELLAALDGVTRAEWQPPLSAVAELNTLLTGARLTQADALKEGEDYAAAGALQASEEQRLLALPEAVRGAMEFEYQSGRPAMLLGDSLYFQGKPLLALAAYERATQRFAAALVKTPLHRRLLEGTIIGYWNISGTLGELQRHAEALAAIDRAAPIAERLVALDPQNRELLRLRETVRGQRAIALSALGRPGEARLLIELNAADRARRAREAPSDAESQRDYAITLRGLANAYRDERDAAGACRTLARTVEQWQAIDSRWPLSEKDRKNEFDVVRAELTACRSR